MDCRVKPGNEEIENLHLLRKFSKHCDYGFRARAKARPGMTLSRQLFQPKAILSSTRVPNFSDERATVLPDSAR
jgi:hypothetical protein